MQISRRSKTQFLKSLPLFAGCSRAELEAIAGVTDEVRLPAGRTLMREGDTGRELVVIVEGEVEVERRGERIAVRGSGDFVGELALIAHRPRSATVTTTADTRALVITGRDFERLARDVPTIALKVLKAVGERLPADDA